MTHPFRFPAEWEPQSGIVIAWPHADTDWSPRLAEVEETYIALIAAITRFQMVIICIDDDDLQTYVEARLRSAHVAMKRVRFTFALYNDTWLRDSGPITLVGTNRNFCLLDFRFTGWGGKFEAKMDDELVSVLDANGLFVNALMHRINFALEGGAIETDGAGTLLTTWRCLHNRHPDHTRTTLDAKLTSWLAQDRVLWLEHGHLEGDDTDAHIDTLARFASTESIVYQSCNDTSDTHYTELQAMAAELTALRTIDGRPYKLFPLPWIKPILDHDRRLAASYANFLIIDGAVLMPTYDDPADTLAQAVLAEAFPEREILPVPCRPLIWQNGSLHCITMQIPAGMLATSPCTG
ncbi:MAG TPA: agmatine deiminase family protein [Xylella sp.]